MSKRADISAFQREVADAGVLTYLFDAGESLDHHPLLRGAVQHFYWNNPLRARQCFGCARPFTGSRHAAAFFITTPTTAAPTSASISGMCERCWDTLSNAEIERAALRVVKKLVPDAKFQP